MELGQGGTEAVSFLGTATPTLAAEGALKLEIRPWASEKFTVMVLLVVEVPLIAGTVIWYGTHGWDETYVTDIASP